MTDDQAASADRDHPGPAAADLPDREAEILLSLANALAHVGSRLDDADTAVQTVMQRQERAWAALKRQENLLLQIIKAIDDDPDREA
jgi:hypothetical protein